MDDFKRVLDHVVVYGCAISTGVTGVSGSREKLRRMVLCLAEGMKRLDQKFLQHAKSIALSRDGRKCRLSLRFVAVDSKLEVRRGVLGRARDFGSGGESIARATIHMLKDMATMYAGACVRVYCAQLTG